MSDSMCRSPMFPANAGAVATSPSAAASTWRNARRYSRSLLRTSIPRPKRTVATDCIQMF